MDGARSLVKFGVLAEEVLELFLLSLFSYVRWGGMCII